MLKDNLEKWVRYLEAQCPTFVFKSSAHLQDRTVVCTDQQPWPFFFFWGGEVAVTFLLMTLIHLFVGLLFQLEKKQRAANVVVPQGRAGRCFGRDSLMQILNQLANNKGDETMLKVGVVGKA